MNEESAKSRFQQILVAVDGSEHGFRAAATAGALAAALGAKLRALVVFHGPSTELGEPNYSQALDTVLGEARETLERARGVILQVGGPEPEVEWLEGAPAGRIVESARERGEDLIVMGSHGRGAIAGALLGSVSQAVAARATQPVLLVGPQAG